MVTPPAETLLQFINELPSNISEGGATMILLGFGALVGDPDEDLRAKLHELVEVEHGPTQAIRCGMAAAALEIFFTPAAKAAEVWSDLNERYDSPAFAKAEAQYYRDLAVHAAALERLQKLRVGPLSPQALREWSDSHIR